MELTAREVSSILDAKKFVDFLFKQYKNDKNWVPPIKASEVNYIYPGAIWKDSCEAKFWVAYQNGKAVGTIGAIINKLYIDKTRERFGRFTRFECVNSQEVASFLLKTAENWLKEKGMIKVHGPLSSSNLEPQGMLIEGFDYLNSMGSVYNKDYYPKLIEHCGYEKENDWIELKITIDNEVIEKLNRIEKSVRIKRQESQLENIEILSFKNISKLLVYTDDIFKLLDETYANIPYSVPISDKLKKHYTEKYLKLLNPKFVKLAVVGNKVIGFIIMMPSLSKALQKTNGSLFPFGFYHLLMGRKKGKTDTLESLLGAVAPKYQAAGTLALMFSQLHKDTADYGLKYIETTGIYENNHSALSSWENYKNRVQHKRRRCYIKKL